MKKLRNAYFAARHGKSLANEQGIILSDPAHGVSGFGLTEEGKAQVRASAEHVKATGTLDASTIIVSSDFARARETAEIIAEVLGTNAPVLTRALRERFFGNWERTHNGNYQKVWDKDAEDASHTYEGVESVNDVLARTTALVEELESAYEGKNIVLVSHGDALQILQTAFEKVHPSTHRSLMHLETAEIRPFLSSAR